MVPHFSLIPGTPPAKFGGDKLTGLFDRSECHGLLGTLMQLARGAEARVALLWVDIDRFRQINASFGHLVGDDFLTEMARRLERVSMHHGPLVRMGGDEFLLVVGWAPAQDAEHIARKLLAAIAQPMSISTTRFRPSASIGIAIAQADEEPHDLLERADRAKLEAKRRGGGQFFVASDAQLPLRGGNALAREELSVEELIRQGMETGGIYLDYQPIRQIAEGRVAGVEAVEALMRCRINDSVIPPGRFIPIAEKTGLIFQLGDLSLVTAARFAMRMRKLGRPLRVAVNVSRAQLLAPTFGRSLHALLTYTEVPPELIELEITESLFMDCSETLQANLRAALEAGFPLALDDFGTGYSSLACLKDLPAAKIKLDRAFVVDLPRDRRSFGVARAVSQLAGDLGIGVVAEGVETAEQFDALCEIGVASMQGFYLAYPMGEAELITWMGANP